MIIAILSVFKVVQLERRMSSIVLAMLERSFSCVVKSGRLQLLVDACRKDVFRELGRATR